MSPGPPVGSLSLALNCQLLQVLAFQIRGSLEAFILMTASASSSCSIGAEGGIYIKGAIGIVAGIVGTNGMNVAGGTKLAGGGCVREQVTCTRKSLTSYRL